MLQKNTSTLIALIAICISVQAISQSNIISTTKKIAAEEKARFNAMRSVQQLSFASPNFQVIYYRCNWNIDPAVRYISGSVTSYFKATVATNSIVYDLSTDLTVDSVICHKQQTGFSQLSNQTLQINLPLTVLKGKKDSVAIYYHGVPPMRNDLTDGFTQTTHNGTYVIWTLSEPYGASDWWPCRNGLDDKADSIDIYITYPSQYKASSNGVNIYTVANGNSLTSYYKHRYPIASYLVAIAVTNYSVFTNTANINGQSMPVIQYAYPEDLSSFQNATPVVLSALHLYSSYFGDYPFVKERYGQTEFSWGGGMEHQTNSFIVSTDVNLITHEMGHQWFGDKVTCGSWQDIWLNEGFAEWLADMFYPEKTGDTATMKSNVSAALASIVSSPDGSVLVDDTTSVDRIFDSRLTYYKGSFLVRMLRFTLGDSLFFKGINQYLTDPKLAYRFARTANLQRDLQNASGQSLNYFFTQWFRGEGYPSFTVNWKDSADHKLYFTVSETTSKPTSVKFFKGPLPLRLINASGTQSADIVLQCTLNHQSFVVNEPGFVVNAVSIDPDKYIISKNNNAVKQANAVATARISVNPNPVINSANIVLENFNGKVLLQLFSNNGSVVWSKQINFQQTSQVQMPVSLLISGTYTLLATDEKGVRQTVTIVK
jgi:aminopeptidase N